jgi:hypothetical protein
LEKGVKSFHSIKDKTHTNTVLKSKELNMNEVAIFENSDFGSIRVADKNGEPWFVGKDICDILGLDNVAEALRGLDSDEKITIINPDGNPRAGIPRNLNFISESGLYSLIFRSRKPEAKAFSKWVRSEVLPSIRKTGKYSVGTVAGSYDSVLPGVVFNDYHLVASLVFDKNQALLSANNATIQACGVDMLKAIGATSLESPQQVRFYTPTELGKEIGKSAVAFNKVLLAKGLQVKTGDKWEATEAGKPYSRMFDTGKRSGGAPVQQMKWSHEVLGVIG